jgi:hypothetical protein
MRVVVVRREEGVVNSPKGEGIRIWRMGGKGWYGYRYLLDIFPT